MGTQEHGAHRETYTLGRASFFWVLVATTTLAAGCSLADESLLDRLRDAGSNTGDSGADSGTDGGTDPGAADRCGAAGVRVLSGSEADIAIDTRELFDTVSSLAGCSLATPGRDGFLGVQVQAGEYWHFHLRVNNAVDPDPASRNPILYLLDSSCSGTSCTQTRLANFCSAQQDEHFGITFSSSGTFYIGIDDGNPGGGAYLLDAIRPVCDTMQAEHGEACDGGDRCSTDCLRVLDSLNGQEQGFNFNFFEANLVDLGGTGLGSITTNGDIGGFEGCAYPDVYAIDVNAGDTLKVNTRRTTTNDCIPTAALELDLRDAAGNRPANSVTTSGGCFEIDRTFPSAGRAFVVLRDMRADNVIPLPYRLDFEVSN